MGEQIEKHLTDATNSITIVLKSRNFMEQDIVNGYLEDAINSLTLALYIGTQPEEKDKAA